MYKLIIGIYYFKQNSSQIVNGSNATAAKRKKSSARREILPNNMPPMAESGGYELPGNSNQIIDNCYSPFPGTRPPNVLTPVFLNGNDQQLTPGKRSNCIRLLKNC